MKKGGYKIIDFKGTALSGTAVEIPGIFNQIVYNYNKPIMVSGVIISGELQDDAYAAVSDTEDTVVLTVYGGAITVTEDDEVTFASVKSNTELAADIATLDSRTALIRVSTTMPLSFNVEDGIHFISIAGGTQINDNTTASNNFRGMLIKDGNVYMVKANTFNWSDELKLTKGASDTAWVVIS